MPSDTFTHSVSVEATPETIHAALQNPETWKGIGPIDDVWDASHHGDELAGFSWSARAAGKTWEGTARRSGDDGIDSMTLDLDSPEIGGSITVSVEPTDAGTSLTVTLDAHSKGLLAGMFWGVVANALRRGLARQVDSFGDRF